MSLSPIVEKPHVFLALLLLCLLVSLASAQSPRTSSRDSTQPTPQTASPKAGLPVGAKPENANQRVETVKWTDVGVFIVMIVGMLLQLGVSAVGFGLIWFQVGLFRVQIEQLNRGIRGETHSRLYDHYLKVTERLAEQSKLRPYFYNPDKELKEDDAGYADLREEIDMMCEIIAGLLEHAAVQEENLPKDSWEACWKAYTIERFAKSVELRKFFRDNYEWYAESFRRVVKAEFPHLILPCGCTTEAAAKQKTCSKGKGT